MPDREIGVDNLGQSDFDIIDDTDNHTPDGFGHWFAILPLGGNAVINVLATKGGDNLSGETLSQDVGYLGRFNSITLTSGKVIAYRSNT